DAQICGQFEKQPGDHELVGAQRQGGDEQPDEPARGAGSSHAGILFDVRRTSNKWFAERWDTGLVAKDAQHPDLEDIELTTVLSALADPVRLGLVRLLSDGVERQWGELDAPV